MKKTRVTQHGTNTFVHPCVLRIHRTLRAYNTCTYKLHGSHLQSAGFDGSVVTTTIRISISVPET